MKLLRWLFVIGPARAYKRGEATGGAVPWLHVFAIAGMAASGAVIGAILGRLTGDVEAGVAAGLITACLLASAWFCYVIVFVGVMRVRGRALESLVGEDWIGRESPWYER